eukprot:2000039-Rhodomonas_salina.1
MSSASLNAYAQLTDPSLPGRSVFPPTSSPNADSTSRIAPVALRGAPVTNNGISPRNPSPPRQHALHTVDRRSAAHAVAEHESHCPCFSCPTPTTTFAPSATTTSPLPTCTRFPGATPGCPAPTPPPLLRAMPLEVDSRVGVRDGGREGPRVVGILVAVGEREVEAAVRECAVLPEQLRPRHRRPPLRT